MTLVVESVNNPTHPKINLNRPIMQKAAKLIDDDGLTLQVNLTKTTRIVYNKGLNLSMVSI